MALLLTLPLFGANCRRNEDLPSNNLDKPWDPPTCANAPPQPDRLSEQRRACTFTQGAKVATTLDLTDAARASIPIKHLVVLMQENRSFDHYFGQLSKAGQPDAEALPKGIALLDASGLPVTPYHERRTCIGSDPPHQWAQMRAAWNEGKNDGFVTAATEKNNDGHYVMQYYDASDLPFYYWLASTFAIGDHNFASILAGTWPNRDYLYAATSDSVKDTGERAISVPTIFDALDAAKITWEVFSDGTPREDALGWDSQHAHVSKYPLFLAALKAGKLPQVSFIDPSGDKQDEHPPGDVQAGEDFSRTIYLAAINSPLWRELAVIFTYDEGGLLYDHVPPPKGCVAAKGQEAFSQLGFRVPLIVVSPWARPHYVSHLQHEHTSITRLIELLFNLPALTARDANSDALLDMFDFTCPALAKVMDAPPAGKGGCK
ncbi:MAG: phospholipase C [Polyangiales bacterium]